MGDGANEHDPSEPNWSSGGGEPSPAPAAPSRSKRYESLGLIGAGGMGLVHSVHDALLGRDVARKRARPGDPGGAEALRREAALAAGLEHPGIVPVYDVGDDGEPWYTMRLVRGRTLRERIEEADQPLLLLRSLLGATEAVAYAHSRGVVHCDLKSSNVMLGEHGEVQVADWGLASVGGGRGGTPRCMSPEQAAGAAATPASDVWGLGLMLLELCGGPSGLDVEQRARLLAEPAGVVFARELAHAPPDLVAVLERCLAHDPLRRYADGKELADELARFLDGRLVGAHHYSLGQLATRWYRRHRGLVQLGVLSLAVLLLVVAAAWWRTAQESVAARQAEADAVQAESRATRHLADALVLAARGAARVHARPEAEVLAAHALALTESPQARGALMAFGDSPAPARSTVARPACRSERLDPFSERRLCLDDGSVRVLDAAGEGWSVPFVAEDAAFAGPFVVVTDASPRAHVFGSNGEALGITDELVAPVSLVSGGARAHLVRADVLETVDPQTRRVNQRSPCGDEAIGSIAELPDGRLAIVCAYAGLGLYDVDADRFASLAVPLPDVGGSFRSLAVSGQGALAMANDRGDLVLVPSHGPTVQRSLPCAVTDLVWTADGARLLASCRRGGAAVLDGRTGVSLGRLPARSGSRFDAHGSSGVVSPDGERWELGALRPARFGGAVGLSAVLAQDGHLLLGGGDGAVVRVRTRDGAEVGRVMPDRRPVKDLASLPGGDVLALGVRLGVWRMRADLSGAAPWNPASGRRLLVLGSDVWVSEYRPVWARIGPEGELVERVPLGERPLRDAAASMDGRWAVGVTEDGRVVRLEAGGAEVTELARFDDASAVVALLHGVAGVARDGELVLLDGGERRALPLPGQRTQALAVSEAGDVLAVAGLDGVVHLLDLDGNVLAVLEGHEERVVDVAFRGDLLVTASWDTTARLWDLRRLRASAEVLVAEAEAAWGLGMEEALAARTW